MTACALAFALLQDPLEEGWRELASVLEAAERRDAPQEVERLRLCAFERAGMSGPELTFDIRALKVFIELETEALGAKGAAYLARWTRAGNAWKVRLVPRGTRSLKLAATEGREEDAIPCARSGLAEMWLPSDDCPDWQVRRILRLVRALCTRQSYPRVPSPSPSEALRMERLIAQLGASDPEEREAATRDLGALGEPTMPSLRAALRSDDAEVRGRAMRLVRVTAEVQEPDGVVRGDWDQALDSLCDFIHANQIRVSEISFAEGTQSEREHADELRSILRKLRELEEKK